MSLKLDMLSRLASAAPVVNQQAADQLQAANQLQLKRAVVAAPPQPNAARAAQTLAPAATANAGQVQLQAQAQTQAQVTDLSKQSVAVQAADQAATQQRTATGQAEGISRDQRRQTLELSRAESASTKKLTRAEIESTKRVASLGLDQDNRLIDMSLRQRTELAAVGRDVKTKILDSRLQFERDEQGRKFSNERQFADYTISHAKDEQELQVRLRELKQASDQKLALLQHSNNKIMEVIKRGWLTKEQKLDYRQKEYLLEVHRKMQEQIAKEQARARNNLLMAQGIGMIVGGVIGSVVPVVGTAAGAAVGAGVGTAVYGATS